MEQKCVGRALWPLPEVPAVCPAAFHGEAQVGGGVLRGYGHGHHSTPSGLPESEAATSICSAPVPSRRTSEGAPHSMPKQVTVCAPSCRAAEFTRTSASGMKATSGRLPLLTATAMDTGSKPGRNCLVC